ncbi:MAG TPA: porin, partial [Terricaulis sp.]|nr:porin [Terricaulis sp.]
MRSFDSPGPWTALPAALAMLSLAGPAAAEGFSFEPRGRIQIDLQNRDWRVLDEDDTDVYVRRFYLGAQGAIAGNWRYKVDLVLTPGIEAVGVDDAFLEYRAEGWALFIGEHNVTSPLEERTSSLDMPFIERSALINAFGYGRRAGLG